MNRRILIIGGGASGMAAAITAAKQGASVTLLEQKDRVGKKILSTGNGKCNMSNRFQEASCYRSADPELPFSVIQRFGFPETLHFFEEMGVLAKERNGCLYPRSGQASSVLDALRFQCEAAGVSVLCGQRVTKLRHSSRGFLAETGAKTFSGDAVILACGGKAAPATGSDGSGYALAEGFHHSTVKTVPALTSLKSSYSGCKALAGIRTASKVFLYCNDKKTAEDFGEVQLTAYGISGIPVFQISRFAAYALCEGKQVECRLDFLPEWEEEALFAWMERQKKERPDVSAGNLLPGLLPKNLWLLLLKESGVSPEKRAGSLQQTEERRLLSKAKRFVFPIVETGDFSQAQVTAGGIRLKEVHLDTMESKLQKGLYLTGELLDTDGICGGYNLQWAWATGVLAGFHSALGRPFQKEKKPCC